MSGQRRSWREVIRRPRVGYVLFALGGSLVLTGLLPVGLCAAVSGVGVLLVRGWESVRAPEWFDDPFWSDWLYWAGVAPSLVFMALVTSGTQQLGPAWIPTWVGLALNALACAYLLGILSGTVRAFIRAFHQPKRA